MFSLMNNIFTFSKELATMCKTQASTFSPAYANVQTAQLWWDLTKSIVHANLAKQK